ncbi:MAG: hypothetical protein GYB50_15285 [Rhodobacteraceae bacterium]|nr:hypothetical protein [Paracoccaceae bacterium]
MTIIASLVGSMVGIVLVAPFAPVLTRFALEFGAAEYFSLMVFALFAAEAVGGSDMLKSLSMVVIGLILGIVGRGVSPGIFRFTFGLPAVADGLNIVAVAIGVFGVSGIISTIAMRSHSTSFERFTFSTMLPTREEWRRSIPAMDRGSAISAVAGILPGAGAAIASFMAYAVALRLSRVPQLFGKGRILGLTAPESANNATAQTPFIPTLTLGVPGDAVLARRGASPRAGTFARACHRRRRGARAAPRHLRAQPRRGRDQYRIPGRRTTDLRRPHRRHTRRLRGDHRHRPAQPRHPAPEGAGRGHLAVHRGGRVRLDAELLHRRQFRPA